MNTDSIKSLEVAFIDFAANLAMNTDYEDANDGMSAHDRLDQLATKLMVAELVLNERISEVDRMHISSEYHIGHHDTNSDQFQRVLIDYQQLLEQVAFLRASVDSLLADVSPGVPETTKVEVKYWIDLIVSTDFLN